MISSINFLPFYQSDLPFSKAKLYFSIKIRPQMEILVQIFYFFNDLIQPTAYYLTRPVLFSYPALEMSTFYGKNVPFYVKIKA